MTRFRNLYILLPCHSLEDFPTHHVGNDAKGLLNNWTALWHPSLINAAEKLPQWHRAEELPPDLESSLVLAPAVSSSTVPHNLTQKCVDANAVLIELETERETIVNLALTELGDKSVDPEIAADFHALGYGYLQIQLMTRQLRYSSNLDCERFGEAVVTAAASAQEGSEQVIEKLQACFDLLLEEKNRYYPVEAQLIDYTLVADTTLGKSLRKQLQRDLPTNLLLTGALAEKIESDFPETKAAIDQALTDQTAQVIGGNHTELPDALLSRNTITRNLIAGHRSVQDTFGVAPVAYARRTAGLTHALPEILEKLDIRFAFHSTLDAGRFPPAHSANIRWESQSGEMVIAATAVPLDASLPESFVNLAIKIGEAIDAEHVSTVAFAHWPDRYCESFEDMLRVHKYGPLLGNFVSVEDYFDAVYDPGYGETHRAGTYRYPLLQNAIALGQEDPVTRFAKYWQRFYRLLWLENLSLMSGVHNGKIPDCVKQIQDLHRKNDSLVMKEEDANIDVALDMVEDQLVESLKGKGGDKSTIINPCGMKRRAHFATTISASDSNQVEHVVVRESQGNQSNWVVEIPSFGHATLDPNLQTRKTKLGPSVVDGFNLRNEFFSIGIDEKTGGMRSLNLYNRRSNLLTQRLAMRRSTGRTKIDKPRYSEMVAKSVDVKAVGGSSLAGLARSHGEMVFDNEKVGEFQQEVSVKRGLKRIEFSIALDLKSELDSKHPWGSYVCNRLAWLEEAATLTRGLHGSRQQIGEQRILAPNYIEIAEPDYQITLLTGGLPFHQRVDRRQLDSLLIVPGETCREFKFALSINHPYPEQALMDWMCPPILLENTELSSQSSGWLFHFSSRNVTPTVSQPIEGENGKLTGVRFRLQETEGRRGDLQIQCPYKIKRALLLNLRGDQMENLQIEENKVKTNFLGCQMFDIEIHW